MNKALNSHLQLGLERYTINLIDNSLEVKKNKYEDCSLQALALKNITS